MPKHKSIYSILVRPRHACRRLCPCSRRVHHTAQRRNLGLRPVDFLTMSHLAGSIFGVSIYYGRKVTQLSCEVREEVQAALERSSEPKPIMAKQFEGRLCKHLTRLSRTRSRNSTRNLKSPPKRSLKLIKLIKLLNYATHH